MLVMSLSPRWDQPLVSRPPALISRPFQSARPRSAKNKGFTWEKLLFWSRLTKVPWMADFPRHPPRMALFGHGAGGATII